MAWPNPNAPRMATSDPKVGIAAVRAVTPDQATTVLPILRLKPEISPKRIGTTVNASRVSGGSSGKRTRSIPPSSTAADRIGSIPFMIIVCTAKLSAVIR